MKSFIPVIILLVALAILAGLQYQWIGEISQAERQRLENNLRDSSERFARISVKSCPAFPECSTRLGPFLGDANLLFVRYQEWKASASHPRLIQNIYALEAVHGDAPRFYELNLETGGAVLTTAPADLSFPFR
jgi:hypothetical protein